MAEVRQKRKNRVKNLMDYMTSVPIPKRDILNECVPISSDERPERPTNNKDLTNSSMWSLHDSINYFPCERAVDALPAWQYVFTETDAGTAITRKDVNLDELIRFEDGEFNMIMRELESFWSSEDKFRDYGLLFKRGILLWGPPGSGKTSLVQIVSQMIVERGGLALYIDNPYTASRGLLRLRQIEPNRKLVLIIEDIDTVINNHSEHSVLALLDGELQIDNVVIIATTNYPERLDRRLVNRPSRFDLVRFIGMPTPETRSIYLKTKNPRLDGEELTMWVKKTDNFSLSHLREVIAAVECLGHDLDTTIARLRKMMADKPSSDDYMHATGDFGFM